MNTPMAHPFALPTSLQGPVLLLATLLFLPGYPASSLKPIHLQRRHSFFRCTGWGAGCSNLDYAFQPVGKAPPTHHRASSALGYRQESRSRSSSALRPLGDYGLNFFFTSGHSWGASGKRGAPSRGEWSRDSKLPTLDILREARLFHLYPTDK